MPGCLAASSPVFGVVKRLSFFFCADKSRGTRAFQNDYIYIPYCFDTWDPGFVAECILELRGVPQDKGGVRLETVSLSDFFSFEYRAD